MQPHAMQGVSGNKPLQFDRQRVFGLRYETVDWRGLLRSRDSFLAVCNQWTATIATTVTAKPSRSARLNAIRSEDAIAAFA